MVGPHPWQLNRPFFLQRPLLMPLAGLLAAMAKQGTQQRRRLGHRAAYANGIPLYTRNPDDLAGLEDSSPSPPYEPQPNS